MDEFAANAKKRYNTHAMILPEQVDQRPVYFQAKRLEEILQSSTTPRYRARTYTFYREADPETERRVLLEPLAIGIGSILVDPEGVPCILIWHQTKKVTPEYEIYGPHQGWRDYHADPPHKIFQKLTISKFSLGLEAALRTTEAVRDRYRPTKGPESTEFAQMVATMDRLREVLVHRSRFRDLTQIELDKIVDENLDFSYAQHLHQARHPYKRRIHQMFARGFYDSHGRKSQLAADSRAFSVELNIRRRLESTRPILTKFAILTEILQFEREINRLVLYRFGQLLGEVVARPIFSDPNFKGKDEQERKSAETSVQNALDLQIQSLYSRVRLRPYVLGARKVLEHLGGVELPEGVISRKLQDQRKERGIPTFWDQVKKSNYQEAKEILEQCQIVIERVLEANSDYRAVKKGVRSKSRLKRRS